MVVSMKIILSSLMQQWSKLFICAPRVLRCLCIFQNYRYHYFHILYSYVLGSVLVFVVSGFKLGSKNFDHGDRESESEDGDESSKGPGKDAKGEYNNTLNT